MHVFHGTRMREIEPLLIVAEVKGASPQTYIEYLDDLGSEIRNERLTNLEKEIKKGILPDVLTLLKL